MIMKVASFLKDGVVVRTSILIGRNFVFEQILVNFTEVHGNEKLVAATRFVYHSVRVKTPTIDRI